MNVGRAITDAMQQQRHREVAWLQGPPGEYDPDRIRDGENAAWDWYRLIVQSERPKAWQ